MMIFEKRMECCDAVAKVGTRNEVEVRLSKVIQQFEGDKKKNADEEYNRKFRCVNTSKATMKELCWEVVEYNTLIQHNQALTSFLERLMTFLNPVQPRVNDLVGEASAKKDDIKDYLRNIYTKKRQPAATHVMVFLVSDEKRNKKPYTLPVYYFPYYSIRDQSVRDKSIKLKNEMAKLGMKTVGKY